MATNRKRTANFTFKEEQFLINLIEKYQDNLENKKTDAGSNSQKNAAWIKIENEFNTLNGEPYRDRKVLKKKYENMKKATKKKLADHKCEINSTGGGPSKKIELTDIDDKIKCILGNRIQSFPSQSCSDSENHIDILEEIKVVNIKEDNSYDSNCIDESNAVATGTQEQIANETEIQVHSFGNSWTKDTSYLQKANASKTERPESEYPINSAMTEKKVSTESIRNKQLDEQHAIKLKCIQERHELDLQLMKEEAKTRMKCITEEHNLKIEILKIQKQKLLN